MKNDKTDNHEQIFWEEIDRLFPDMIKAIASLSKKSYLSITNLRTGITWWSERAMDYFGMKENYTIRGMEKANRKIHPDDVATFKRGFKERVDGKNLDTAGNTGFRMAIPTTVSTPWRVYFMMNKSSLLSSLSAMIIMEFLMKWTLSQVSIRNRH